MKEVLVAATAFVVVAGVAVLISESDSGPGPIPTCNGEQATHVLVEHGTVGNYQEWIDAGVNVVSDPDNAFRGTWGHDVMVSLVETSAGGFISEPLKTPTSPKPTAGDFMCSAVPGADDIYYATHGRSDVIIDSGGGNDLYFLGGCDLEGEGSPGDRKCDRLVSKGGGHDDTDRIWGFTVPKGRTQRIVLDDSMDHVYVGRGAGKVFVSAAGAPTHVNGGGDHIHPCPFNNDERKNISGLETFTKYKITAVDVEYFGSEAAFLPLNQVNDPCAYQARGL